MIYGMFAVLYLALPYNDSLSSCYGAHVVINNQTNQPNLFQGFDLPVGYQSNVNVKRTYIHRLSAPYSDCVNSPKDHPSELTDIFINNNLGYTQQDCFNYCSKFHSIDHIVINRISSSSKKNNRHVWLLHTDISLLDKKYFTMFVLFGIELSVERVHYFCWRRSYQKL